MGRCTQVRYDEYGLLAKDMDDTHAAGSHHVRQGNIDVVRDLPWSRGTTHLPKNFGDVSEAGRSQRMSHGDQATATVHRDATINRRTALLKEPRSLPWWRQPQSPLAARYLWRSCRFGSLIDMPSG